MYKENHQHPDLLWVLTSVGWMQAGELIPDPIKSVNDLINKDLQNRGTGGSGSVGWHPPKDYGQTLCNND